MSIKRTSLGWRIYATIPDSRGNILRVQESSQVADRRSPGWLWLMLDEAEPNKVERETWERTVKQRSNPSPHLSVAQVKKLRAALDAFLKDYA